MKESDQDWLPRVAEVRERLRDGTEPVILLEEYEELRAARKKKRELGRQIGAPPEAPLLGGLNPSGFN